MEVFNDKQLKAYTCLLSVILCGLAAATITAGKVMHLGFNFPFSNIVFSMFTYPLVDCICELWGKKLARQTIYFALSFQFFMVVLLQVSIVVPSAPYWENKEAYNLILSTSGMVMIASFLAFFISQLLDIFIYQKIRNLCHGKMLWLRSNISTIIGQFVDSTIFVTLVFYSSQHKFNILLGSFMIKIIISILMTPVIYGTVIFIHRYLDDNSQAFKCDIANTLE